MSKTSKQCALQWFGEEICDHLGSRAVLHCDDVFIKEIFDVKIFDVHMASAPA